MFLDAASEKDLLDALADGPKEMMQLSQILTQQDETRFGLGVVWYTMKKLEQEGKITVRDGDPIPNHPNARQWILSLPTTEPAADTAQNEGETP